MDSLIINRYNDNDIVINRDSYVVISDEIQAKDIKVNILNCKATVVIIGQCLVKEFNFVNSDVILIEIINDNKIKELTINNTSSVVEYNVIDLSNTNINYDMISNSVSDGSDTCVNIASVCYKEKNKNYVIKTLNKKRNTVHEVNCFGIVKDNSILNCDVSSFIEKGAKKSIVRQNSNILLFDEKSLGKSNPILLIEENDVKASHGSSIGKVDDETMFYLCSRGLTKSEATNLICLGKIEHLIKKIEDQSIREKLINDFKERMG